MFFFRALPLCRSLVEGAQLPEVEIDTGEGILDPDSGNRCDHELSGMEHPLHYGKGPFHQGSGSADGFVPPVLLDRERVAPGCPVHGLIHGCLRFHPEVALIPIYRLPVPGKIDPAIMHRCGGCLDPPDELVLLIHEDMEFVTKPRLRSLFGPGAIAAPPCPGLITPRSIRGCVAGVGGDERRILNDTPLDREPLGFELPLKLFPDRRVFAGTRQALPEQPDRRLIRNRLGIPQKMTK